MEMVDVLGIFARELREPPSEHLRAAASIRNNNVRSWLNLLFEGARAGCVQFTLSCWHECDLDGLCLEELTR